MSDDVVVAGKAGAVTTAEGLEDLDQSDLSMPRLNIVHDKGVLRDSLDGREYDKLEVVALGLVKQRVLWPPEMQDGPPQPPLCKSLDHAFGYPDEDTFPWESSGFTPDAVPRPLPCATCKLKDWGSHPTRKDSTWCAEQFVLPVLMPLENGYAPALVTFQRSGIKPTKAYLAGYARENAPAFTSYTSISFETNRRGTVTYSVPKFVRGGKTPDEDWGEFSSQLMLIRKFLQAPRVKDDGPEAAYKTVESDTEATQPAAGGPAPAAFAGEDPF